MLKISGFYCIYYSSNCTSIGVIAAIVVVVCVLILIGVIILVIVIVIYVSKKKGNGYSIFSKYNFVIY